MEARGPASTLGWGWVGIDFHTSVYFTMVDWFGELPGFLRVRESSENVPSSGCNTAICSPSLKIMLIFNHHPWNRVSQCSSISPFEDKPKFHGVDMIDFFNLQDVCHGHRDAHICWDIWPCVLVKNKRSYFLIVIALQINNNYSLIKGWQIDIGLRLFWELHLSQRKTNQVQETSPECWPLDNLPHQSGPHSWQSDHTFSETKIILRIFSENRQLCQS